MGQDELLKCASYTEFDLDSEVSSLWLSGVSLET